jgi:hypothetical protein
VRAVAETSYRADVAFCVMTLLAALVIACDTDPGGSDALSVSSLDRDVQASVQVDQQSSRANPDTRTADARPGSITRR